VGQPLFLYTSENYIIAVAMPGKPEELPFLKAAMKNVSGVDGSAPKELYL